VIGQIGKQGVDPNEGSIHSAHVYPVWHTKTTCDDRFTFLIGESVRYITQPSLFCPIASKSSTLGLIKRQIRVKRASIIGYTRYMNTNEVTRDLGGSRRGNRLSSILVNLCYNQ
jgi:hypothetical protein